MGRWLKTTLPTTAKLLKLQLHRSVHGQMKKRQLKQKLYFDWGARDLPDLLKGETIRFRVGNKWQPAVVKQSHVQPRSFVVQTPDGNTFRRNRRHLMKTRDDILPTQDGADLLW